MNRAEARAALDNMEIEYPKSGSGSGLADLLKLLPVKPEDSLKPVEWWVFRPAPAKHDANVMVRPGNRPPGKGPGPGKFELVTDADLPGWAKPVADKMRHPKKR